MMEQNIKRWTRSGLFFLITSAFYPTIALAIVEPGTETDPDQTITVIGKRPAVPAWGSNMPSGSVQVPTGMTSGLWDSINEFYEDVNNRQKDSTVVKNQQKNSDVRCVAGMKDLANVTSQSPYTSRFDAASRLQAITSASYSPNWVDWVSDWMQVALYGGYGDFHYSFRITYADNISEYWVVQITGYGLKGPPVGPVIDHSNYNLFPGSGQVSPSPNCP